MKSKTSFFNKTIFVKNLTRFWPIWAVYLVIWIFVLPVMLGTNLRYMEPDILNIRNGLLEVVGTGGIISAAVFSIPAAAAVYSYMYNARSTSFMASLPIKREGMFATSFLSGLSWFIGSNLIVFLLLMCVEASYNCLDMAGLVSAFGIMSLQAVVFFGIATLCAVVAGNVWGFGISYIALNCAPLIFEILVNFIGQILLKGIEFGSGFVTRIITPGFILWGRVYSEYNDKGNIIRVQYTNWTSLAIYAAVGIIFAILALLIYRKRKMETASDLISTRPFRPVFKYCATFIISLGLGLVLYEILAANIYYKNVFLLIICMLIGAFVGYFASEMMLSKSFRVFKKWPGYAVSAVVIVLLMICIDTDVFGIESYVPKIDDVKEVYVYTHGGDTLFTDKDAIADVLDIHSLIVNNDDYDSVRYDYYNTVVGLTYELNSGRYVKRYYYIGMENNVNELYTKLDKLLNSGKAIISRKFGKIDVNENTVSSANIDVYNYETGYVDTFYLTPPQVVELYETCLVPDIMDGNLGKTILSYKNDDEMWYEDGVLYEVGDGTYKQTNSENTTSYSLGIELAYENNGYWRYENVYFDVTSEAVRTWSYFQNAIASGQLSSAGESYDGELVD